MNSTFTLNLVDDFTAMFSFHFMVNAMRAGIIVAVVAGPVGYLMVMRQQSFVGHTLSVIGFPGAAAAVWLGLNPIAGYFVFCVLGALAIAAVTSPRGAKSLSVQENSAVTGTVQAFALAVGFLFVTLYHGYLDGMNALLFGSITGVSDDQVIVLAVAAAVTLVAVLAMWRRLVFASLDPLVAQTYGVSARGMSAVFLLLLGIGVAGASQITGSLLTFAALIAPAATASRLTTRPGVGAMLSTVIALVVIASGEAAAYFTEYPVGFWVSSIAFAVFLIAVAIGAASRRYRVRRVSASAITVESPA